VLGPGGLSRVNLRHVVRRDVLAVGRCGVVLTVGVVVRILEKSSVSQGAASKRASDSETVKAKKVKVKVRRWGRKHQANG
jgi:hypothetical protein